MGSLAGGRRDYELARNRSGAAGGGVNEPRPSARELLEQGSGYLTRSHLRELGLPRGAIDTVFRRLDVVYYEGYKRPLVRVEDFVRLTAESTYGHGRVRPT
jgi:hypothetical protein